MVNLAPIGSFQKFFFKKWILILHNKIPKQPLVKDFFKNPQKTKTKRAQTPSTSRSCYMLPSVLGWIPSLGQLHYPREKETGENNNTHRILQGWMAHSVSPDGPDCSGEGSNTSKLTLLEFTALKLEVWFLLYLNMCLNTWSRKRPFIPMLY